VAALTSKGERRQFVIGFPPALLIRRISTATAVVNRTALVARLSAIRLRAFAISLLMRCRLAAAADTEPAPPAQARAAGYSIGVRRKCNKTFDPPAVGV
jgi:hypothetical protein